MLSNKFWAITFLNVFTPVSKNVQAQQKYSKNKKFSFQGVYFRPLERVGFLFIRFGFRKARSFIKFSIRLKFSKPFIQIFVCLFLVILVIYFQGLKNNLNFIRKRKKMNFISGNRTIRRWIIF
jgi:hypothetical protein